MFPLLVFSDYMALRLPVRSDSLAAHFFPELVGHSDVPSGGPLLSPQVLVASCDELGGPGRARITWADRRVDRDLKYKLWPTRLWVGLSM